MDSEIQRLVDKRIEEMVKKHLKIKVERDLIGIVIALQWDRKTIDYIRLELPKTK